LSKIIENNVTVDPYSEGGAQSLASNMISVDNMFEYKPLGDHSKKMPAVGKTKVFPRIDNYYTSKESLPYDEAQTKVWRNREKKYSREKFKEWAAYILVGMISGTVAFIMIQSEEFILDTVNVTLRYLIRGDCHLTDELVEEWAAHGTTIYEQNPGKDDGDNKKY
jgi:hypothetical protein